jgi:hypothetical protein
MKDINIIVNLQMHISEADLVNWIKPNGDVCKSRQEVVQLMQDLYEEGALTLDDLLMWSKESGDINIS